MINDHEFGNGTAIFTVTATQRGEFAHQMQVGMWASMCRSLSLWRFHPSAAEVVTLRRSPYARKRGSAFYRSSRQSRRVGQPGYAQARTSNAYMK